MTKEELQKAMINDEDIAPAPSKIDTAREKRHSSLTLIGEAIRLLSNMGLKKDEIITAVGAVAKEAGETPEIVKKISDAVFKNYDSAWEKATKRLEEEKRVDIYQKAAEKKAERKEKKDYRKMEEEEIEMLMAEIEHSAKKRGVKLSKKELRMRAIKAMKERWGE